MRSRILAWAIPAAITLLTVGFFAWMIALPTHDPANADSPYPTILAMLLIALIPVGALLYHRAAVRDTRPDGGDAP